MRTEGRLPKLKRLRAEYENAMLNENLDSYDDLLAAVEDVLISQNVPPLIHKDVKDQI